MDSSLQQVETIQKSVLEFQVVHGGQGSGSAVFAACTPRRHEMQVGSEVAIRRREQSVRPLQLPQLHASINPRIIRA